MTEDFFDRCIDLEFYDNQGRLMHEGTAVGKVTTPLIGPKPAIHVSTSRINLGTYLSTKLTITNYDNTFPLMEDVGFIDIRMYYGAQRVHNLVTGLVQRSGHILVHVLDTDQLKGAPDREVVFNCCEGSLSPGLSVGAVSFAASQNADGSLAKVSYEMLIEQMVASYNASIAKEFSTVDTNFLSKLMLTVNWQYADAEAKHYQVTPPEGTYTFQSAMHVVQALVCKLYADPRDPSSVIKESKYCLILAGNQLFVVNRPEETSSHLSYLYAKNTVRLDHVISAFRTGPEITVKMLYDPRVQPFTVCEIERSLVSVMRGRGIGQKLVQLTNDRKGTLKFHARSGIQISFGTVRENIMTISGTIVEGIA